MLVEKLSFCRALLLASSSLCLAGTAFAQDSAHESETAANESPESEIVVTGSRIIGSKGSVAKIGGSQR
jgi:hypothetical protein